MFEIPIFSEEKDISDRIKSGCSIAHLVECKEIIPTDPLFPSQTEILKLSASKDPERKNFDLHYLQALLVTSVLNENHDYFSPLELWQSRNTVADKPFNLEHECDNIIGHTVGGYVIDEAGKIIPNDTAVDNLPDILHIVATSVIYKYWAKEDKQAKMNQLLAEVKDGKWFVSVECLFPTFDYMLMKAGKNRIIARNEKTAFLTKYLKAYGGTGVYNDEQIARVPRNFILSGKGLVAKPANKQSVIFAKKLEVLKSSLIFQNNLENLIDKNSKVYTNLEVIKMNETDKVAFEAQIKSLTAELAKRDSEYTQLKASIDNKTLQEVTVQKDKLQKDIEARDQEILSLKASVEKFNADKLETAKEVEKINAAKKELEDKLGKIEAGEKYNKRLELATSKLKMTVENAKAFVDGLTKLDDESYGKHVDFQAQFITAAVVTGSTTTIVPDPKVLPEPKKDIPAVVITQITAGESNKKLREAFAGLMDTKRNIQEKPKFQKV